MYQRLLVALDGSTAAERVLEHAEALASAFGSTITLVRATVSTEMVLAQEAPGNGGIGQLTPVPPVDPLPVVQAEESAAADYLERVANRLKQRGLQVITEHIDGLPNQVIVERAEALNIDLILMTTHGRSGLGRMVFGSTADSVLRHARCPVLLVRVTEDAP
jgi:nucleotide-binding universal stress UspA family protein